MNLKKLNKQEASPLVFDLFCGLGGWSEAFIARGYRAIGFDIEAHDYGSGGYPGELVLRDIRSLNGAEMVREYGIPACIVASPPCQEFSYMAMPWSKAKDKMKKILADPAEQKRLTDLFNQCFRIQREVSEAAGRYVPMVVENVRGACRWVGKARWNFGSFYLWGDVPALMPIPSKLRKTAEGSWDLTRQNYNPDHKWEGVKAAGMNWSDPTKRGQDFTRIATLQAEVRKQRGSGRAWFAGEGTIGRTTTSGTLARKRASAEIAKIPPALADWIAKCFDPRNEK